MWRFLHAALPECAVTLVEFDEAVAAIAQHWFYLTQPPVIDRAESFLEPQGEAFNVILVDLYDAEGSTVLPPAFWARCLDRLSPCGSIAVNWPHRDDRTKAMAASLSEAAGGRGKTTFFAAPRAEGGNIVQFVSMTGTPLESVKESFDRFSIHHGLFQDGRGFNDDHLLTSAFPEKA